MSKFKIGDKVRVKSVYGLEKLYPSAEALYSMYPHLSYTFEVLETFEEEGFVWYHLNDEEKGFVFVAENLELVVDSEEAITNPTQRTLLGLETEAHLLEKEAAELWKKIWSLRDEIQKLKELEE